MPKKGVQSLICCVCGDKAIAFNFGVQSCESCKAFFRRNAFRDHTFSCYFDNKCEVDVIRRRFCRKCRLRKCFEVGMNTAYIFSDEQKNKRKAIVEENRRKSKVNNELNAIHSSNTSSQTQSDSSLNDTNNIEESYDEDFPMIPIANQITTYDKNLNQIEMNRLAELLNATQKIRDPVSKVTSEATVYPEVRQTFAIKGEQEIKRFALMCRHLSAFTGICDEDKISLLKAGCVEIVPMRSLIAYNNERQYWAIVLDSNNTTIITLESLKKCNQNVYEINKNFFTKFGGEWDFDSIILDLLTAVALFTPDRPNIIHKNVVKLQQQMYIHLLRRYLRLKYSDT
ncbi:unnamed protein product [Oppiella nova]|uniref:Nuclear receptor domain-containing protein n=1 Tax=Oppiella nova TaxID=334625 RepID=A0A7R9LGA5_9ACAR|nr:unnamed protein product [Oppiella nova]CAG2163399.1 unnamed protein product [Oppiella nova]